MKQMSSKFVSKNLDTFLICSYNDYKDLFDIIAFSKMKGESVIYKKKNLLSFSIVFSFFLITLVSSVDTYSEWMGLYHDKQHSARTDLTGPDYPDSLIDWKFKTSDQVISTPVVGPGEYFFDDSHSTNYTESTENIWTQKSQKEVWHSSASEFLGNGMCHIKRRCVTAHIIRSYSALLYDLDYCLFYSIGSIGLTKPL